MSARINSICSLVIVLALAAFIGWSIISEMPVFVPIAGFVVALLLIRLCRRFTKRLWWMKGYRRLMKGPQLQVIVFPAF